MLLNALRRRTVPLLGAVAAFALVPLTLADARGDDKHDDDAQPLVRGALAASLPSDPSIFKVTPGGAPWVLERGSFRLEDDGRLQLRVRGLVIPTPPFNGTNPVGLLTASVYCNEVSVGTTEPVAFDPSGDARIDQDVGTLPSPCAAPAVLVHPNALTTRFIAFNGSR